MEIINLNLIPGKAWPVAHATQFDKGREFRANLFEGSQVYTLAGDETVDAIIKKPDGNQVIETLVNTADNYVIVTTTEQMTAVAGPSLGEIRITKDDTVIGSLKFILECEQSADTGIESHSEINNLATQVADLVSEQYDSNNVIFDAVPTAGHGNGYTVTSEGIKDALDAINNPAASAVSYDNTASGLAATNAQDAIDEVVDVVNDNFADAYDPTATYNTGDVCIYNNVLYICTADNITGTFDPSKWTATTIDNVIGSLSQLTTTDKSSLVGAVNSLVGWVDATSEFTKTSNFDTTQNSYFLYNDALKMYAVSFAVKANTTDNGVILSSVPKLKNDIIVLPTGFANAGGLSITQANVMYYKANDNIVLMISTTTNVPVFVTAFLLKA